MYTISFTQAEQALRTAGAGVTLAEAHGCLCGALCILPQFSTQSWLQELLPDPTEDSLPTTAAPDAALTQLYTETQLALQGDAMEFSPLLPDDEAPIDERIAALAQWSQGFLYGFGIGIPAAQKRFPGEVGEILKDLSEIARAGEEESSGSDAEEESYTELVEYLRAAAQLVHDELAGQRAEQAQQRPRADGMH
ncbi:MAG: UPF0149 family protein [Steroidobacteraceae bacterium]